MTKLTLTVATPEADRDDTTHLGIALGWIEGFTPSEWERAFTSQWQDAEGNLYRVMSMPVRDTFVYAAVGMGPVERPPEDVGTLDPDTGEYGAPYVVNLTAARRAQDKLVVWQPKPETDSPVPKVGADKIVAVVGMKGREAITAIGLEPLPIDGF
jgi:hypothetical protein